MMKNLMNAMMLSCVKATELLEMKEHVPLSFLRIKQLHMHTVMCSGCRNYGKQSRLINEVLQKNYITVTIIENTDSLEEKIISRDIS